MICGLIGAAGAGATASASDCGLGKKFLTQLHATLAQTGDMNLIDWKVGDSLNHDIKLASFPLGTSHKEVYKDEGDALWFRQTMVMMNNNDISEILISKANGQILKFIRNGKEEEIPESNIEIIEQKHTSVTVPAGTFEVIYIKAKSDDSDSIEIWLNPRDIAMDGAAKQAVATQMGTVTLELTAQKKASR